MKKVVIVTARSGYPNGYGASSILRKYSSGFTKIGFNTSILMLRPSETKGNVNTMNKEVSGVHNNVNFEYMCGTVFTHSNVFIRLWIYFIGIINTIKYINKNRNSIERIFFYSPDYLLSTLLLQITCKILKIRCVGVKTESSYSDSQRKKSKFWKTKEKYIYRLFSSMIVISTYLKKQLSEFYSKKDINIIPIVVDENMYDNVKVVEKSNTIIYMGTLKYHDELNHLIDSYKIVHKEFANWKLNIIGGFVSNKLEVKLKEKVKKLGLENHVVWKGNIESDLLPNAINEGKILVLPRVVDEYSNAGFPIKLGEYLLTGSPTVVTNTGDIGKYLKDKKNAFLVPPNDVNSFANSVISVIKNYDDAMEVGKRGRELALNEFGSTEICKKMLEC